MSHGVQNLLTVVAACLLLWPSPVSAHHGAFYKKVFRAVQARDLDSIKDLFAESAWYGKSGGLSAADLQRRLENGEPGPLAKQNALRLSERASFDKKRSRCLVTFRLKCREDEKREKQFWLLAKYVGGTGNVNPKAWQIVRIVNDKDEALFFLGQWLGARVFPMQVGHKWVYAWDGREVVFEVLRTEKSGDRKIFVVRRTIGDSSVDFRLAIEKDGVYVHQEGTKKFEPPLRAFAFGVERKGGSKPQNTWKWRGTFDGKPRTENFESLQLAEVTVPSGNYFVTGIRRSNPGTGDEATFWLAHGVGVVKLSGKSESLADDPKAAKVTFEWSLKSFHTGKE